MYITDKQETTVPSPNGGQWAPNFGVDKASFRRSRTTNAHVRRGRSPTCGDKGWKEKREKKLYNGIKERYESTNHSVGEFARFLHPFDVVVKLHLEHPSECLSMGAQVVLRGRRDEDLVDEGVREPGRARCFWLGA